jgi:alpha-L-fucosidase
LAGKTFTVKALGTDAVHAKGRVTGVRLLGHEGALTFSQDAAGLHVTLPEKAPGEHAFAFRIEGVS